MSSLVDSEELIRSDVLDCRQADQSAERLSAALATRVLGHRPIHGAGVTRVTERASWAFLGGYSAGITLGELIHGAPSTVLPHYVDALRTSYARVLPEDASQAPFVDQEDSVVHLFGLHEPVFAVLFVVTDSSIDFTDGAKKLLKHSVELCLSKGRIPSGDAPEQRGAQSPVSSDFFSERQHQVLELLAEGRSNTEIGRKLSISGSLAKQEVAFLMHSLGAKTRLDAVVKAQQNGILPTVSHPSARTEQTIP